MENKSQANLLSIQLNSAIEGLNDVVKRTQNQISQNYSNKLLTIQDLKAKTSEILSKAKNDPETEQDFRRICSLYETQSSSSDQSLFQAYQEYVDAYRKITSLYLIDKNNERTILTIYGTENDREETCELETPEMLDHGTCIAQLPNGELFCFGKWQPSGIAFILDRNLKFRRLPSGPAYGCPSAIYFNKNVYCFGGRSYNSFSTLSSKFDLVGNRWIKLTPMPRVDLSCRSVIFNGNVLISGWGKRNILIYSIDTDSFSTTPYNFQLDKLNILINAEDRLYLIESPNGSVYESEIGNEYVWEAIGNSIISFWPFRDYYSFNKGITNMPIGSYSEKLKILAE
ncbi:unnamed protein product [Blepharisma stoltei]|uniref:Kelch motif family protein n=1 Tax=Blepharisma stoltei TaxID=1481888 RepID=A0AAU9KH25_9CILI|nr:unnamed protein product [Blepharisma stoltei]